MAVNYTDWSVEKLKKELVKIEKAIKTLESRDKKAALAQVMAVAKKNGFELHELVGLAPKKVVVEKTKAKPSKKRGKVPPKYRNPANAAQTWTGRGRQPLWIQELVNAGHSLDDVRISNS